MPIPNDFRFSQTNLQDYLDCPRRFELRYIQKLKWPAEPTQSHEDQELFIQRGLMFHRSVRQYFMGLPAEILEQRLIDPTLVDWWKNFLAWCENEPFLNKPFSEITLQGKLFERRFIASYDLVTQQNNGKILIIDWKTTPSRAASQFLKKRVQSKLYPVLLLAAGRHLFEESKDFLPHNLEMMYWFTGHPEDPEIFTYSQAQYEEDLYFLQKVIEEVEQTPLHAFRQTTDTKRCNYCVYRSLCERGKKAGEWNKDSEDLLDIDLGNLLESMMNELDQKGEAWL